MNKPILILVLALFSALTLYVVSLIGLHNVWIHNLNHPAGWQIFADLAITLCLLLVYIHRDAQATGRRFWPWAVFSLIVGSFGPLLYFISAKAKR